MYVSYIKLILKIAEFTVYTTILYSMQDEASHKELSRSLLYNDLCTSIIFGDVIMPKSAVA